MITGDVGRLPCRLHRPAAWAIDSSGAEGTIKHRKINIHPRLDALGRDQTDRLIVMEPFAYPVQENAAVGGALVGGKVNERIRLNVSLLQFFNQLARVSFKIHNNGDLENGWPIQQPIDQTKWGLITPIQTDPVPTGLIERLGIASDFERLPRRGGNLAKRCFTELIEPIRKRLKRGLVAVASTTVLP